MMDGLFARARSLWHGLRRRSQLEHEMAEEFQVHQAMRAADLVRSGLSPAEAMRQARLEFGSAERYKEEGRESRGLRLVDEVRGDLRYAARSLRRSPVFTAAAVLTLALGVGANAAVFSLVSASVLRPLPFEEADRLVVLHQTYAEGEAEGAPFRWWTHAQFEALESRLTTVAPLAAYWGSDVNLASADGEPVRVRMEMVSASYFPALAVRPALGRAFLPPEDSIPGAHPVAVLGRGLWLRHFGGDPQVLGRTVALNGVPVTVIGVAPAGFRGLTGDAEMWIPHAMAPLIQFPEYLTSDQYFLGVVGRLRPGVSLDRARAEVAIVGASAAAEMRAAGLAEERGDGTWGAGLRSLEEARRVPAAVRAQLVLVGAAVVVLLIALINLSALLLARSTARARELAVRAALGAGRLRLVRHGAVEGALLGVAGGVVGVLLAAWSVHALIALAPEDWGAPRLSVAGLAAFAEPRVDWRVIAYAGAVAITAGVLAGLLPVLRTTKGDLARTLKTGARGSSVGVGSLRRPTVLSAAATLQVACALVLLVGAGLLLQAFHRLGSADPGFEPEGIVTFSISPPRNRYAADGAVPLVEQVLARVEAVPGVVAATVGCAPFGGCGSTTLNIVGRPTDDPPRIGWNRVGPDHFRALGIPLLRGRAFTADDRAGRPRVAIINATAASRLFPGEDPIGKRVWFGYAGFESQDAPTEIVGVVGDVPYGPPGDEIRPDVYTSYLQFTLPATSVMVRAAGDPLALVPDLRRAVAAVDPDLPIHGVQSLRERGAEALAPERFATTALAVFAGLGLLLASLGVYGVMMYSVAQRRREIGIRLALGATPREVWRFVVAQGLALSVLGLALGTVAALALVRALPALIADVGALDPVVFAAVVAVLLAVAVMACALPARMATRVNPVDTIAAD